jgi:hypothetical protein
MLTLTYAPDLKVPFALYGPLYYYSITVVACGADHSGTLVYIYIYIYMLTYGDIW